MLPWGTCEKEGRPNASQIFPCLFSDLPEQASEANAHPQDTSNTSGSCLGKSASCIRKQTHWLLLGTLQCVDAVNAPFLFCKSVDEWSSLLWDTVLGKMLQAIAMPPLNLCGGMVRRRSRVLIRPLGWTVTSMKKSVLIEQRCKKSS